MTEALEWAADFVVRSKIFEPIKNERGYADGWKPPSPAEKAAIITELAREAASSAEPQSDTAISRADAAQLAIETITRLIHPPKEGDRLLPLEHTYGSELRVAFSGR